MQLERSMSAQASAPPPATGVLTILTVRPDPSREAVMAALPAETRETVRLYLDGKITQWYGRGDGKGVVFVLNCTTVDEARAITDTLPFATMKLATFDYLVLTPLTPLRVWLTESANAPKQ